MTNLINTRNQACNIVPQAYGGLRSEGDSNTKTIIVLNIQTYPQGTIKK